jgi:peptide/nickel transport system permease protein
MIVGIGAVALALAIGIPLGLTAGFLGGRVDAAIAHRRRALTFLAILVAVIIDGALRTAAGPAGHDNVSAWVLVCGIACRAGSSTRASCAARRSPKRTANMSRRRG